MRRTLIAAACMAGVGLLGLLLVGCGAEDASGGAARPGDEDASGIVYLMPERLPEGYALFSKLPSEPHRRDPVIATRVALYREPGTSVLGDGRAVVLFRHHPDDTRDSDPLEGPAPESTPDDQFSIPDDQFYGDTPPEDRFEVDGMRAGIFEDDGLIGAGWNERSAELRGGKIVTRGLDRATVRELAEVVITDWDRAQELLADIGLERVYEGPSPYGSANTDPGRLTYNLRFTGPSEAERIEMSVWEPGAPLPELDLFFAGAEVVEVRGRSGVLIQSSQDGRVVLTWMENRTLAVSIQAWALSPDYLLDLAESLRELSEEEWEEIPMVQPR